MDNDRINELKVKGNACFGKKQLEDAIGFYVQAIDMAKAGIGHDSEIAILLSNTAQAYLQLKQFENALNAADESLRYDPTFKKSMLRRAIANLELGHLNEAERELRALIKGEPKNIVMLSLIRRIRPAVELSTALLKAHTANYLRRVTIHAKPKQYVNIHVILEDSFIAFLLRIAKTILELTLSHYRRSLSINVQSAADSELDMLQLMEFPSLLLSTCFNLSNLHIVFKSDANVIVAGLGSSVSTVNYAFDDDMRIPSGMALKAISTHSKILTILSSLPASPGMKQLHNLLFPKLDIIWILKGRLIDGNFLKAWKENKWPASRILFSSSELDLSAFENFKGVINHTVNKIDLALSNEDKFITGVSTEELKRFKAALETLKKCFPSLSAVTGRFSLGIMEKDFDGAFLDMQFKKDLKSLVEKLDSTVRPEWCEKFQVEVVIGVCFGNEYRLGSNMMKKIERLFKDFQREMGSKLKNSFLRWPPIESKIESYSYQVHFMMI